MSTGLYRTFTTALESLTQRHQQLLAWHELDRLSVEHIGELLGLSAAEARIELRAARVAVRRSLADQRHAAA